VTETPFSYDALDELLRGDGHNDYIGMSAIDGMIAALVAGPEAVPADEWLPLIFAGHRPSRVKGSSESRAGLTIAARYDEVERTLAQQPSAYQPILMHDLGQFILRPWALGFMMGMSTRQDAWLPVLLKKRLALAPILACSELGRPMLPDLSATDIERVAAKDPSQVAAVVTTIKRFHKNGKHKQNIKTPRVRSTEHRRR
jgi:yecA family protein